MAFTIQPTGLSYFQKKKSVSVPAGIARRFYASWEDALWDLLRKANVRSHATVLVPDFFCQDVLENMAEHHLKPVFYSMDKNFQTDPEYFARTLKKEQPAVVVILHPAGITNPLFTYADVWKNALSAETILIEDSVHRVVMPEDVHLIHPRHVVMDSLRKVIPVPGSNVYGTPEFLQFAATPFTATLPYQIATFGWWAVFQLCLLCAQLPLGMRWNHWSNNQAENAMLAGYDVIGDSYRAGRAWSIFRSMADHIAFARISAAKQEQVQQYFAMLEDTWNATCYPISFPPEDAGRLRGLPVRLELKSAQRILTFLRKNGILLRFELEGCPWTQRHKVMYLPLGPHLNESDIRLVGRTLAKAMQHASASTG